MAGTAPTVDDFEMFIRAAAMQARAALAILDRLEGGGAVVGA